MRRIKELAPKYSDAIRAMIDGLKKQSAREDFVIVMNTYGRCNNYICFGCAATCTIQELSGKNYKHKVIRDFTSKALYTNIFASDLANFESCIDDFRAGITCSLLWFYDLEDVDFPVPDWYLSTDNWQEELPKVENYLEEVIKLGY